MDERQQKALVIAATSKIVKRGDETWIVPSQSLNGKYAVTGSPEGRRCTCPDFELRQQPCKHILAVEFVIKRETVTGPDGTTTVTETAAVRVTYAQNWPAYNTAPKTEKAHFLNLLHDLCALVPRPPQGNGRPPLPMADRLFCAAFKVYSGMSARRFATDVRTARDEGLISDAPSYNSVIRYLEDETMTPILHELITASSLPLREVEQGFAADSTGFGTSNYYRYYSQKYEHAQYGRAWIKTHAMVGTKTNVVTAVKIGGMNDADAPQLPELIEKTAENFDMREVSADKAYSSRKNLELIESVGAAAFIPFKSNAKPEAKWGRKSETWTRLYHFFALHRDEFCEHYHKRSNVESTFSMIQAHLRRLRAQHDASCADQRSALEGGAKPGYGPEIGNSTP